jgi:hypothetical protein
MLSWVKITGRYGGWTDHSRDLQYWYSNTSQAITHWQISVTRRDKAPERLLATPLGEDESRTHLRNCQRWRNSLPNRHPIVTRQSDSTVTLATTRASTFFLLFALSPARFLSQAPPPWTLGESCIYCKHTRKDSYDQVFQCCFPSALPARTRFAINSLHPRPERHSAWQCSSLCAYCFLVER